MPKTMEQVFSFLDQQPYPAEVIVVENGSRDRTLEVAKTYEAEHPELRVIVESERGKGRAVRSGMLAAKGKYRFMCDADFSMPAQEINRFLPPALENIDIAIASREAEGAVRYNEPHFRHIVGRVFNTLIRLMVLPDLHDTQCGFKCFRAEIAEDLFRIQTITGWSFDVEVLYIASLRGYHIEEIPIPWYFSSESKVNVLQDSFRMGLDLLNIRLNNLRGRYCASG